jgi:aromatic ring hydroxylase
MDAMDRFVSRENIERYRRLSNETTDAAERLRILKLLAEEEASFKLELSGRGDAPEERSSVSMATEHRVEHDGEKQQGGR